MTIPRFFLLKLSLASLALFPLVASAGSVLDPRQIFEQVDRFLDMPQDFREDFREGDELFADVYYRVVVDICNDSSQLFYLGHQPGGAHGWQAPVKATRVDCAAVTRPTQDSLADFQVNGPLRVRTGSSLPSPVPRTQLELRYAAAQGNQLRDAVLGLDATQTELLEVVFSSVVIRDGRVLDIARVTARYTESSGQTFVYEYVLGRGLPFGAQTIYEVPLTPGYMGGWVRERVVNLKP